MSNFNPCPICHELVWVKENHKCKPIYLFKHEYWGDEFQEIRAVNHHQAAEKVAKLYNENGDYALMGSEETVIISDGAKEIKFKVSAEQSIDYTVTEVLKK